LKRAQETKREELDGITMKLDEAAAANEQLITERDMLSAALDQKSVETSELTQTNETLKMELKVARENAVELEKTQLELGRIQLESTQRQRQLDATRQSLTDEREKAARFAQGDRDHALAEAESKIDELKKGLNQRDEQLRVELAKSEELTRLRAECDKMDSLNDHQVGLENANLRLLTEVNRCEQQCNLYKDTIDELNGRLASLTSDFDSYRRDNDTEKEHLKMELREAIAQGDIEHELVHVQEQLRVKQNEFNEQRATCESLQEQAKSSESMIREMIAEREILEKALESTKANFSRVEGDYRQVRATLQANESEMAKMKGTINAQADEMKRLKSQAESWQYKYQNQASILVTLKQEMGQVQSTAQTLKAQLQESNMSRQTAAAEVDTLNKSRQQLLSQSEKLVLAKGTLEKEIVQFREREISAKNQLAQLEHLKQSAIQRENEKHEKLQFQLARSAEIKEQLTRLKNESVLAGEDLEREIGARNELEKRLEQMEHDNGQMGTANKRLQAQIDERKTEFNEMDEQCRELTLTNQKLSASMSEARSTINELGRRLAETQMAWENEKSRRWVDDESVNACQQCKEPFTMMVRRHHCRKCGGIFCYSCSNFTLVLPSSNKPQRVCQPCQRG
jgi:early endosome antigen 1